MAPENQEELDNEVCRDGQWSELPPESLMLLKAGATAGLMVIADADKDP